MTTDPSYRKPLPTITSANEPFWTAAKAHVLKLPRCSDCGHWVYPIAPMCQHCWSENLAWQALSGRGTISSWVVFHRAFDPSFAADIPYLVVEVNLEEGMRFLSNIVDVSAAEIYAGMPVEAVFDDVTAAITLVKFRQRGQSMQ